LAEAVVGERALQEPGEAVSAQARRAPGEPAQRAGWWERAPQVSGRAVSPGQALVLPAQAELAQA